MAKRDRQKNPCAHCDYPAYYHVSALHLKNHGCPGYEEQRIFRASPSSVKTYGQCQRRWAARALGGIKVPMSDAQKFGEVLHTMAEEYLLTGKIPDQDTPEGRLMIEGIPHLPKRRLTQEEVEGEINFTFDGVPWIGYYDWIEFDIRRIGDHKSSSDPKRWGLNAKQLPDDIQACSYAWFTKWDETNLRWLYYSKKSRNAYPVDATVSRKHAEQVIRSYSPIAREMQKLFDANPATLTIEQLNELPNDPSSCDHCGRGCDFAQHCTLIKPSALVRKQLVGNELDEAKAKNMAASDRIAEIRAKLEAKKNGGAVNPPEASEAVKDTLKEVANEVPKSAPASEPAPEPAAAAEPEKKRRGRPPGAAKTGAEETIDPYVPPAPAASEAAPPQTPRINMDLAALGAIAANLPAGVKLTITLG